MWCSKLISKGVGNEYFFNFRSILTFTISPIPLEQGYIIVELSCRLDLKWPWNSCRKSIRDVKTIFSAYTREPVQKESEFASALSLWLRFKIENWYQYEQNKSRVYVEMSRQALIRYNYLLQLPITIYQCIQTLQERFFRFSRRLY